MEWIKREYSRGQVNRAGAALINPETSAGDRANYLAVVNNWRAAHAYPLSVFQEYLRGKREDVSPDGGIVSQRIKRLQAILKKLERREIENLARMQDIAGCRAVVGELPRLNRLRDAYGQAQFKHKLVREDDYIATPKPSGYRSIHRIYRYHSYYNDYYNGLNIEVQLRTWEQHCWATAVELIGTVRKEDLKSGYGDERWRRFFILMSSVLAMREKTPAVPGTPEKREELLAEINSLINDLDVIDILEGYSTAIKTIIEGDYAHSGYFLLALHLQEKMIKIKPYNQPDLIEYFENDHQLLSSVDGLDVVLVSADSIKALETAYPNYFLNIKRFLREINRARETKLSPVFYSAKPDREDAAYRYYNPA